MKNGNKQAAAVYPNLIDTTPLTPLVFPNHFPLTYLTSNLMLISVI